MPRPLSRSALLSLLSEASELEHSLACSYLFAAFSLKRGQVDGLAWRDEQTVRRWAAQLYFVASQEMLHLAQVWNIAQAIGGTPYWGRPAFPQPRGYLPIAELSLERYSAATLDRFLQWEAPEKVKAARAFVRLASAPDPDATYSSVGELYGLIKKALESLRERDLFLGDPALQIGPELADFPELLRVTNQASAIAAIDRIRAQGEGSPEDREDCHFGVFADLRRELDEHPALVPAHLVAPNPFLGGASSGTRVTDPASRAAMRLFDDVYATMLRLLGWVFGPAAPAAAWTRAAARGAIAAMPIVLKPLGETLATLPSGHEGMNAGAPFSPFRHIALPADPDLARRLVAERMAELVVRADDLLTDHPTLAAALSWLPDRIRATDAILRE